MIREEIRKEIKEMTEEKLKEMLKIIKDELESRKETKILKLETDGWFDRRKHGAAYVARLRLVNGKIEREFINYSFKEWDRKRKYYRAEWEIEVKDGEVYEARLTDGSWRNDYKVWFIIENGKQKHLKSLKEARDYLKGGK